MKKKEYFGILNSITDELETVETRYSKPRKTYLSVVLPAYNEERRISGTLEEIFTYLKGQEYSYEVVVVDDGSNDRTSKLVEDLQNKFSELILVKCARNRGKGIAVKKGMRIAEGRYRVFLDSDHATPINEIEKAWDHLEAGSEVVIGSRRLPESKLAPPQPWYRRMLGRVANYTIQLLLLPGIQDTQCGFKVFTDRAARQIFPNLSVAGYGFDMEVLVLAKKEKYKITEIPVNWRNRLPSRVRPVWDGWRTLKTLWRLRRNYQRVN